MTHNQTSITYNKSFDNLVNVMAQIGHTLPAFEKYTELFRGTQPIQQVLCLFYQDILDVYSTFLEFFRHTGIYQHVFNYYLICNSRWLSIITHYSYRMEIILRCAMAKISRTYSGDHGKR